MNYHSSVLRQKMQRKGFSKELIDKVLSDCKRRGLIDDEGAVLREFRKGYGPRYIEYKLQSSDVRRLVTRELQRKKILEMLSKYKERQKAFRVLQRKGFDLDILMEIFSLREVD